MELWQKLQKGKLIPRADGLDRTEGEVWINNIYTVFVNNRGSGIVWLSIKRNDKEPCNDWRHFQWIKNQLIGEENEAIQIYPAESRLIDGSNQYHLFCFEDAAYKIPFGFNEGRKVSRRPMQNGKQRGWPKNMLPPDIIN